MPDSLQKPFIIALTFVGISALLITVTGEVTVWSVTPSDEDNPVEGWETIGGFDINWWTPTDGYDVDPTDTEVNYFSEGEWQSLESWLEWNYDDGDDYYGFEPPYGSSPGIRVWVMRDNPDYNPGGIEWWEQAEDFFLITRHTQDWPVKNIRKTIIPFEDVFQNQMEENRTYISFRLGQLTNVTMFINATSDIQDAIYNDFNYTLRIGTPFGAQIASTSMWTVLGQLLTMRLPNCHPVVNALLAIPLWAGIGFTAVMIVRGFIPLLG